MARNQTRIAVIGGGLAGLSAAYFLVRNGFHVELFEASDGLGGLARSFDFEGLSVERYYHFICLSDHELLELADELGLRPRWRQTRTTFYYDGRLHPFTTPLDLLRFRPIPVTARFAMGMETLRWSMRRDWRELDRVAAREWLLSRVGEEVYRVVWEPLLVSKFGERHDEVSAAWLWHRIHRVAKSRKSALHPQVMGYFPGGTESMVTRLHDRILARGGRVELESPAELVLVDADRVQGVRVAGRDLKFDAVMSTAPLPRTAAIVPDDHAHFRSRLEEVEFLGVVCVVLWLEKGVTNSFWCNINDPDLELIGTIEMSELNRETGRGGALVYVPFYVPIESKLFHASDEEVHALVTKELSRVTPRRGGIKTLAYRVFRSRFAQPVCPVGFSEKVPGHRTPLAGFYLIDSTQMYPMDRSLSGTVALARNATRILSSDLDRGL